MGSMIALAEAVELEPTFLPEGWEIKVVGSAEDMDAPAIGAQLISADEKTGEVVAIVGVTGIIDHVGDLIEPGAYSDTLTKRRPKVCWAHDWEQPIGKVPAIEEWAPGDPRFQQVKATLDGKPWPSSAGALVARMQFNMKSTRGSEAFAAVDFYSETGECEWSIGWQTVPGQTVKRKDGVRVCKKVELYEVSPVLFGAAPFTRTLQLKTLNLDDATRTAIEHKTVTMHRPDEGEDEEHRVHRLGLPELDWAEIDGAAKIHTEGGSLAEGGGHFTLPGGSVSTVTNSGTDGKSMVVDLKAMTAALEGDAADIDFDALAAGLEVKADDHPVRDNGAHGDGNKGNANSLIKWYLPGHAGGDEIRWGEDGDFDRCVALAGKHMETDRAKGFCNLRHHDALGIYPATHAKLVHAAEHAAEGKKSAGVQAAEMLAKSWNPMLEVGRDAASVERKVMSNSAELAGTYEQRQRALQDELTELLRDLNRAGELPESGDLDEDTTPAAVVQGHPDDWVYIDGTWDDHAVATYVAFGNGSERQRQSYSVPYTWDGEDITLGDPSPVQLQVSVVPMDADGDYDGDGPGEDDDDIADALVAPVISALGYGSDGLKGLLAHAPETKVGMVLSGANGTRLKTAIEHLVQVAKAAGIDLSGLMPDHPGTATPLGQMPDTTAPGTPAAQSGVKVLSTGQVEADLAEIRDFLS